MTPLSLAATLAADLAKALADDSFARSRRLREAATSAECEWYEVGLAEGSHTAYLDCERRFRALAEVAA